MSDTVSRRGWSPAFGLGLVLAVSLGLATLGAPETSSEGVESSPDSSGFPPDSDREIRGSTSASVPGLPSLTRDIRIRAIVEAYGSRFDSVQFRNDDVVFFMAGGPVYFQAGRMLAESNVDRAQEYDPIFYFYSPGPFRAPPPRSDPPTYSTDFLEHLFGESEDDIREHGVSSEFLNRKVFVNAVCFEALQEVEEEIQALAAVDPDVDDWIQDIAVAYSFIDKEIAGSGGRSYHAWGMAIDLVPTSYGGKHVYWRWSRVFNRNSWTQIPLEDRWSPPQGVIQAFENHGFVWGGKWSYFDTIHFEYRPEILAFNRLLAELLP